MAHAIPLPSAARRPSTHGTRSWMTALAVALSISAACVYVAAYFVPWWTITLFAPQYPDGLSVAIGLRGIRGDVHEIDMLNHYIGMGHLEDAANLETRVSAYAVGALVLAVLILGLRAKKRLAIAIAAASAAFPIAFLADSFYWLHRFGHHLDPRAPLRMAPFTPHLLGEGHIGQFSTIASPMIGFWLALAAAVLVCAASVLRVRLAKGTPPSATPADLAGERATSAPADASTQPE